MTKVKKLIIEIENLKKEIEKSNNEIISLKKENELLKHEFKLLEEYNNTINNELRKEILNEYVDNENIEANKSKKERKEYLDEITSMYAYD